MEAADHWVASWIEQLAAEGITNGCAPNRFCPGRTVTRAEMAAFLVRTFGLAVP
ncbi:MAG TPA: S-layer homology domain-containing protein [Thermoanaerobaculia bacterium]|nr:S-layer homology domain-containing protein [Thermoanaerobaculia bacterium]